MKQIVRALCDNMEHTDTLVVYVIGNGVPTVINNCAAVEYPKVYMRGTIYYSKKYSEKFKFNSYTVVVCTDENVEQCGEIIVFFVCEDKWWAHVQLFATATIVQVKLDQILRMLVVMKVRVRLC